MTLAAGWSASLPAAAAATGVEILFKRDGSLYDGRFANNGWLQELPKPVTKLTWDNAALVAPRTAERLGVQNGDLLTVSHDGRIDRGAGVDRPGPRPGVDHHRPRLRPHAAPAASAPASA